MTQQAIILEMHIARLEGRLDGVTSQERFQNFLRQIRQSEQRRAFYQQYPVLARVTMTIVQLWADFSLEFLEHLCADWADICTTFAQGKEPGMLAEVHWGVGDTHRNGKSVAIVSFSSGLKVVYKPRSLSLDQHFQDILAWINRQQTTLPLRITTLLNKGEHGWVEFLQTGSCETPEEVGRFYQRQGIYLALLYALGAGDFHHENVLACGEYPMLVDLEALFHPRFALTDSEGGGTDAISFSVLRTGLLPHRSDGAVEEGVEGIDTSGLGGKGGQLTPRPVPTWKESGTDQMHLTRERMKIRERGNRPKLQGQDVEMLAYEATLLQGFTQMYQLIIEHRETWLTQLLPLFVHDEIRVILRHTRNYAMLLAESHHPERLRDILECEELFDHLWGDTSYLPHLSSVIRAEQRDLLQGDIPLFTTQPTSKDIFTSQRERIADFCAESGMEYAIKCIQQMDERDLARQLWIIKASLATTLTEDGIQARSWHLNAPNASEISEMAPEDLLQAARAIGDRLQDLAMEGKGGINWLSIGRISEIQERTIWRLQAMDRFTLYDGIPGMILFFGYLGLLTGDTSYTQLAKRALAPLQQLLETTFQHNESVNANIHKPLPIGALYGLGSLIYLFSHLSVLWQDPFYSVLAEQLLPELDALIDQDNSYDIIHGSAGCLVSLLSLYTVTPSPRTLASALRCGEHLLAAAQPMPEGIGWITANQEVALAGFSHGIAGIALSLFQLAAVSQQERFREAALAALTYERSLFSLEEGNWARLRNANEKHYQITWCHGAPGVGLSRLASLPYLNDEQVRQEIEIALETTRKRGFGGNHSLCHGDLGNIEIILMATQVLDEPRYHVALKQLTALSFKRAQEHGWVTGVPLGIETPGLMTGLAGIGYELLRLARPESVPSVLVLAPPLQSNSHDSIAGNW